VADVLQKEGLGQEAYARGGGGQGEERGDC
jgi:hypothetical protein